MNRKLPECESCLKWNKKENKMRNELWCMIECNFRINHCWHIATAFNRATGSKQGELEHGKEVI